MKYLTIFSITCVVMISVVAGDIHTSNSYYTHGASVHEDVSVHNVAYVNNVNILPDILSVSGGGVADDNASDWSFKDAITAETSRGDIGGHVFVQSPGVASKLLAGIKPNENDVYGPSWSKQVVVGSREEGLGSVVFNYALSSGHADAGCYDPFTAFGEDLSLVNINGGYSGTLEATTEGISANCGGLRVSVEDSDSGFDHDIWLTHMGKVCTIDSELTSIKKEDVLATPVLYAWYLDVNSNRDNWAEAGVDVLVVAGDRVIDTSVTGTSSELDPKLVGPIHIDPILGGVGMDVDIQDLLDVVITRELYMKYTLT